jgi:hypothetical protein
MDVAAAAHITEAKANPIGPVTIVRLTVAPTYPTTTSQVHVLPSECSPPEINITSLAERSLISLLLVRKYSVCIFSIVVKNNVCF